MTALLSTIAEAWQEVRVHRGRIILALSGVALAVAILCSVFAMGQISTAATKSAMEKQNGRAATIMVQPPSAAQSSQQVSENFAGIVERYQVKYWSTELNGQVTFQFPDGTRSTQTSFGGGDYNTVLTVAMKKGAWFSSTDAQRMAPAVIVNETMYDLLGQPALDSNPSITIASPREMTGVIVGVAKNQYQYDPIRAYMLQGQAEAVFPIKQSQFASLRMWVPTDRADELTAQMSAELTPTGQNVQRVDYLSIGDPFLPMQLTIAAIGALVLLLGAVGLLNINLVTIKYRVAEIGVRRSFGATTGRIFAGIILESVVATFLAGVAGVVLVILIYQSPLLPAILAGTGAQLPPFPVEAALVGVVSATVVGALAGLLPAIYAVRAKVIDAIRV